MRQKLRHIIFGSFGIYLFFLTCYLLYAGIFQLNNTIQHNLNMGVIGFDRLDYGEYTAYVFIRFASFLLVPLTQLVIVGFGFSCLFVTPPAKQIRKMAYLFCALAVFMIIRSLIACIVNLATFRDIPRAILFFVFANKWERYQEDTMKHCEEIKKVYFPFIQEFRKLKSTTLDS